MAAWWLTNTIVCGTTAFAALLYSIIILHRRVNEETDGADDNIAFEIKITNEPLPNLHNERQIFVKNSASSINTPLTSKVGQVSHLRKHNTSDASVKIIRSKRLFPMKSKTERNLVIQNNARSLVRNDSSETVILNNSASSCESGFGSAHGNLDYSSIIYTDNLTDSANNRVQIQLQISIKSAKLSMFDKLKKAKMFNASDNRSAKVVINQNGKSQEFNIMLPSYR